MRLGAWWFLGFAVCWRVAGDAAAVALLFSLKAQGRAGTRGTESAILGSSKHVCMSVAFAIVFCQGVIACQDMT